MPIIQQSGITNCNKTSIAFTKIFRKDSYSYRRNSSPSATGSVSQRNSNNISRKLNTTSKRVNLQKPSTRTSSTKPLIVYTVRDNNNLYYNLSAQLLPYSNVVLWYYQNSSTIGIPLRLTLSIIYTLLRIITTSIKTITSRKLPITLEVVSQILLKSSARKSISSTLYIKSLITQESQQIERTLSILTYIALLIVLIPLQRILILRARYRLGE